MGEGKDVCNGRVVTGFVRRWEVRDVRKERPEAKLGPVWGKREGREGGKGVR